ncbi:hypothetical protein AV530_002021 [Patagioenas fasciata monilis]|uniref:Uncharacterized protein n=1 Tax=Patagioenas fasciata monilis TaxID=372326 RepID=A0A1V4J6C8_PATFA|nr:hypothetical protein AV530_002021 [Patagioenas fasciata monilis]
MDLLNLRMEEGEKAEEQFPVSSSVPGAPGRDEPQQAALRKSRKKYENNPRDSTGDLFTRPNNAGFMVWKAETRTVELKEKKKSKRPDTAHRRRE